MTIKETIQRIVQEELPVQVLPGIVKSVDEQRMTCRVDLKTLPDMLDVRLRASIDGSQSGWLVTPVVNSPVLVALINNDFASAFICAYSEVERLRVLTDDIQLAGENYGGLVKAPELKKQVDKNSLILDLLLQVLATPVTEPGNGSPSALQAALNAALQGKPTADLSNIENQKVRHG